MNHVIFQIVFSNESRLQSHAGVAELADAYGSGPYGGNPMKVQVLSPAPSITNRPLMRPVFIYRHLNGTASEKQLRLCPITHIFGYTHLPELPPSDMDAGRSRLFSALSTRLSGTSPAQSRPCTRQQTRHRFSDASPAQTASTDTYASIPPGARPASRGRRQ